MTPEAAPDLPPSDPPAAAAGGAALAALSVCESLLISLIERGLVDPAELEDVLGAAFEANLKADCARYGRADHDQATVLIRELLVRCQTTLPDRAS
ncbi:MAG: hypothetical protein WD100_05815 [Tistlia sp.]|uniref:hypothetical protein n=1 Tax=Tistlia sp. TaxID=3057121 RepID=UPI0034A3763C